MNSLTSFIALTTAIFGAITALLILLSRLEPNAADARSAGAADRLADHQRHDERRPDARGFI